MTLSGKKLIPKKKLEGLKRKQLDNVNCVMRASEEARARYPVTWYEVSHWTKDKGY